MFRCALPRSARAGDGAGLRRGRSGGLGTGKARSRRGYIDLGRDTPDLGPETECLRGGKARYRPGNIGLGALKERSRLEV